MRLEKRNRPMRAKVEFADLPDAQKLTVQECLAAAKKGGKQGRRYTCDWVYECLLMRIKSPSLYESIRRKDILPLPSRSTLAKYIRSFDSGFGFKKKLFETLRSKVMCMSMQQRRGALLLDEMKLSEGLSFNRKDVNIIGFTDNI